MFCRVLSAACGFSACICFRFVVIFLSGLFSFALSSPHGSPYFASWPSFVLLHVFVIFSSVRFARFLELLSVFAYLKAFVFFKFSSCN